MHNRRDLWKAIYSCFDPKRRLETADRALYVERPGSVAADILTDLSEGLEQEGKWVICGSTGSGKSSELVHLYDRLQGTRVTIGLDLPNSVARCDQLQPAEVLFLLGAAAARWAQDLGLSVPASAIQDLNDSFSGVLERPYTVNLSEVVQGVALFAANVASGVPGVVGAAGGAARALGGLKDKVSRSPLGGMARPLREGDPDLDRLLRAVNTLLGHIRTPDQPPVLIVDGLDKTVDPAVIRELFVTTGLLSLPQAQIVYSGPIALMLSPEWQATKGSFLAARLTNVATHAPALRWVGISEEKARQGRESLQRVIERRLASLGLTPAQILDDQAAELIIIASGGLLRDLIQIVNRAARLSLRAGEDRISVPIAEAAVVEVRREYEIALNSERIRELEHVRTHGRPSSGGGISQDLLTNGYILPYSNGKIWFAPHPILQGLYAAA